MKQFSSEAVTKGHPDKIADQISDTLLDAYLQKDFNAKIAIETIVTKQKVIILGEIKTCAQLSNNEITNIIKNTIKNIGYVKKEENFSYNDVSIINLIHEQSKEINQAVVNKGAGDQGLMFGYATDETSLFMPLNFLLARNLALKLTEARETKTLPFLRPDGKTQVTIMYDDNNNPLYIDSIVISCQHEKSVSQQYLHKNIITNIINTTIPRKLICSQTKFYINPSGSFINGGPCYDTGLTGRKIIQDNYGGEVRHGGGCFSGKDPSKVDRSGAYMMRYLAKNIVASGICNKCEIQIAYAIGLDFPIGFFINTFNTNKVPESLIIKTIKQKFDLSPQGIIRKLNLTKPIFQITAKEGHFGRQDDLFEWEKTDNTNIFKKLLKSNR
ncbi:methionine adenosyltransferase [Candidatus Phytoplasma melaleucae]|uniref:Methionine adenosyltransferase n=1 Tax=Candidatus Phytoplasma melaleucae TaxID=2982630 RepID=A0ABT9DFC2_9MOLU|nr:methionine adenosyltransferase ['Melaleuca sp.' phytoplasma]MDO8168084.1 methionine adenosyltransferase ['Melaleuca sp.' phytoplasma]MDV3205365.1 methionine adenosyltransferase [Weeping tea tree witches'-broom phytoplasma]